jgi:hypothetical protein
MKFVLTGKYLEVADIRGGVPHTGIDMRMGENTVLRSIKEGFVERVIHNDKIGNGVVIHWEDGRNYIYGHLNKIFVEHGDKIEKGQAFALSGNTGNSSGPHLHFAVQDHGNFIDPTAIGPDVAAMAGGSGNWFVDKWNAAGDFVIGKETNLIWKPFWEMVHDFLLSCWHWFITYLPDIMGYSAVLAGVCIILGAMFGRGGMIKPLAMYAGSLIVSICLLMGNK